ncbi:signal peptidase I [Nocardioides sp. BP30]|uniref:signal peptidase I n=1 Tax=Nocardioides sp. BP30 TaxID=3036374 RepID=UPI002469BB63|nr:signal peptidase I [Nocardioides sp. BP30]WGL53712.1 signal peptidase I [Nocardioides sp. BP30]
MTSEDRDLSLFLDEEQEGSRSSASQDGGGRKGRNPRSLPVWQESILLLVLAVVIALVIKSFFVQAFYIPSASMEPGLQGGPGIASDDRVLVEKPSYWGSGTPQRGDIVVFSDPGGWLSAEEDTQATNPVSKLLARIGLFPTGGHLVKRVIGVAGDTIVCCDKQGRIEVNGKALDETGYAKPASRSCADTAGAGVCYGPMARTAHWKAGPVPAGYLFVMGDNRDNSADSSYHLCTDAETDCSQSPWVPVDDVVGKVVSLVWPLGRAHIIHRPADFATVPRP